MRQQPYNLHYQQITKFYYQILWLKYWHNLQQNHPTQTPSSVFRQLSPERKFANGAITGDFSRVFGELAKQSSSLKDDTGNSSVLDGSVGEGAFLYGGKIVVYASSIDASLTTEQILTVKSDLELIFEKGEKEGRQLFNSLSVDRPLKTSVNSVGSNSGYLKGYVLSIDLSTKFYFQDQNTLGITTASTTRIMGHEMAHALLGKYDIHPMIPMLKFGKISIQNSPVVRFNDKLMKNIFAKKASWRRFY